jgi:hypothetical protein
VFGEEKTYHAFTGALGLRLWLNKYKVPAVMFFSPLGLLPHWDQDLHVVVGPPVELPKLEQPSQEDVNKYHALYVQALQALFEKHKKAYAGEGATLEVF